MQLMHIFELRAEISHILDKMVMRESSQKMAPEPKITKNGTKENAYKFLRQSPGVPKSTLFGETNPIYHKTRRLVLGILDLRLFQGLF